MEALSVIFHEALYRPLLNALISIYALLPIKDLGIAILVLTVAIRTIFLPLSLRAARSQQQLTRLQPKIKELQERYKQNKDRQMKEMMALYREHNVNPLGGCIPILIQLPILIGMYRVFIAGLTPETLAGLYAFVPQPEVIQQQFLGLIDLTEKSILLALIAGVAQFGLSKLMRFNVSGSGGAGGKYDFTKALSWQMTYFFPFFTVFIAWSFPAALALYWAATTVFSLVQQVYVNRQLEKGSQQTPA